MIRAVIFDFYGVWAPDLLSGYVESVQDPAVKQLVAQEVDDYYHGRATLDQIVGTLKFKAGRADVDASKFAMHENTIAPELVTFLRNLHGHFLKLGIVANLGIAENELLNTFNSHQNLFEIIASPLTFKEPVSLLNDELFAAALQVLGEPPKTCLAVSGNPQYRQFVEDIGMRSLSFEGLPKLEQEINQILLSDTPDLNPAK